MNIENYLAWAPMVAALAAVVTLVWQINLETQSLKRKEIEVKRAAKIQIISDLVAYRFVLTSGGSLQNRQDATLAFDTALSRIPIDFIEHDEVLRKYQKLGNDFTSEKYYDLIKAMLESAGRHVPAYFTVKLLESVPSKSIGIG